MTTEEFKTELDTYDYFYVEKEGKILVGGKNIYIWLSNCVSIPSGVVFSNSGIVHLKTLIGKSFHKWDGHIEGIDSKRLLNKMISEGLFDR